MRDQGVRVGLAFALGTPLAQLEPVITLVDAALLLPKVTGEGAKGASFNPLVLPRIRTVRTMAQAAKPALDLQVAGGVKREHVANLAAHSASALALGAKLYKAVDMAAEVATIRHLIAVERSI